MAKAINPPNYWTYEKCEIEINKYSEMREFIKNSNSAYRKINKMKWYNLLENLKKTNKKWSFEECKEEVNKFTTLKDFREKSKSAYDKIKRMNWHYLMIKLKQPTKWNYEKCNELALLCLTKKEFQDIYSNAYAHALRNNFLDDICSHMTPLGNKYIRMVYAYEFNLNDNKFIYVGITCNEKRRKYEHLNKNSDSPINKFMIENNTKYYTYIKISNYISATEAQKLEKDTLENYINNGYIPLNKAKTGALGGSTLFWTFEKCQEEALKYNNKSDFNKKFGGAWLSAKKNNWLDIITKHMVSKIYWTNDKILEDALTYDKIYDYKKYSKGYAALYRYYLKGKIDDIFYNKCTKHMTYYLKIITLEDCIEDALKYNTKREWKENSKIFYSKAYKNNWLSMCCKHMIKKDKNKYILEDCINDASKYNTKREWKENSNPTYQKAYRMKWIIQCCSHMVKIKHVKYTLEDCIEDASKYNTKIEWCKSSNALYNRACKMNWLDICCKHMIILKQHYTLENCINDALKYNTISDWRKHSERIYQKTCKMKWIIQCCSHMVKKIRPAKYTLEDCINDALKYDTKTVWKENSYSIYKKAYRNNWFTQCTAHMVRKPRTKKPTISD